MSRVFTVGLIKASLPSYFPDKHNVWSDTQRALSQLCDSLAADLFVAPTIPMGAIDTMRALDECQAAGADFILLLHGGFTMGDVARTVAATALRAGFWSVPEPIRTGDIQLNNFVSLNMSMSIARQVRDLQTQPIQWYHGSPDSAKLLERLRTTFVALKAIKALDGARIGVVGGLAMTFYNMEVSSSELRKRLGVEVAHHDIHELTQRMETIDASRIDAEGKQIARAATVDGVTQSQMELTIRAALALRDMAADYHYAALAVSDWPALQTHPGMHPGAAFTWLEEMDGIPVASEGDVLGAITQLVAKALTDRCGYLLDMTEPDLDTGKLLMWHGGGGPLYLADDEGARWINHPMIGRGTEAGPIYGAIADLVFRNGEVSVFRVARDAKAFFHMRCQVVSHEHSGFTGCRGWLSDFVMDERAHSLEDVVHTVMSHGLEHHFVLVPGNLTASLAEFAAWSGMQTLDTRTMKTHLDIRDFS